MENDFKSDQIIESKAKKSEFVTAFSKALICFMETAGVDKPYYFNV